MRKLPTTLLLACGACALGSISAKAYSYTRVTDYEPNETVYGYYDYYSFKGCDDLGTLRNEIVRVYGLEGYSSVWNKPSGAINGGTLGYCEKVSGGDLVGIEGEYLNGKPDSNYSFINKAKLDTVTGLTHLDALTGRTQLDLKRASVRFYWTPAEAKYLTWGVDYMHDDITASNRGIETIDGVLDNHYWQKLSTSSDDVQLTMALKTPNLYFFKSGWNELYLNARGQAGVGYAYRTGGTGYSFDTYNVKGVDNGGRLPFSLFDTKAKAKGIDSNLAGNMPRDAGIYSYSGSAELAFRTQWGTISAIAGYKFKGDISESSNSEQGFFTSLGYRYGW